MISVNIIPEIFTTSNNLYFVVLNTKGYYIAVNPCFLKKLGLREAAVSKVNTFEIIYSEDQADFARAIDDCQHRPGNPITIDLRIPVSQTGLLYTRWEFTCLQKNNSFCIQGIGFDIHDNKATADVTDLFYKKGASSIEEIQRILLSNCIDVFLLTNEKNDITYCSHNIKKVLGYESGELIGTNGFSYVHPDDIAMALKSFADEITNPGQNHSIDLRFKQKEGGWKWIETKGSSLFHHPEVKSMLINLNDISARKKNEQIHEESELRYKSFFNHLSIPLFIIGHNNLEIIDVNDCAVEKYGFSKEELTSFSFTRLFKEEITSAGIEEMYSNGKAAVHTTKTGRDILVTISKQELFFSDAGSYVLLVTDVTEANYVQQENEVGYDVSEILIQPRSLNENLETALKRIRLFTGWDLAEMWVPDQEELSIKKTVVDYTDGINNSKIEHFLQLTSSFTYMIQDYDPVIKTELKPYWIDNLKDNGFEFKRKKIALSCGFQSSLIVPVINEKNVVFVFSFFSLKQKLYNKREANLIGILGKLCGAEIEKRKNGLMLDTFFQISNDILTIGGLDGRYKRVNPAFEKFIGYSNEEAKKIHPLSYVHDFDKEAVLSKLNELSEGISVPYFENRVITKDRVTKWIAWTATPIISEGIVIASHRDITAQKEAAEELRISNERYELIRNATNEAIWDHNILTGEVTMNQGYKLLFGHDFTDAESEDDFWISNIHPDEKENVVNGFTDFMHQHKTPHWECEYRFKKKDGTYANVVDRGYMIFNSNNIPVRVVGAMIDISKQKKLEQELIVRERVKQNQIAQAVVFAQEKERAEIGKELHDNVGQLLTTTKLYLEMLKQKLDDPVELIERGTKHINTVIHSIRNLSHSLVPSSINDLGLTASVNDLIENIRALEKIDIYYVSSADIESKIEKSLKLTLYRIIQEQLNNIIKHAYASKVTIELFEEEDFIKLIITDDGKGFEVETVKMGLGLKNITSRAELQNGSVNIISNPDKGCKILIQIPVII